MNQMALRRFVGGVFAAVAIAGCASPFRDAHPRHERGVSEYRPIRNSSDEVLRPPGEDREGALPALDADATLETYLRYAALNNAGLEARFQDWRAAVERVPQVSALPDPRFTYGYYLSEVETRVGPMQQAFALSQTFPWFGKLRDREDAASRNANAMYQRFESERLALAYRVERAYNELYYLKRSIDITGENLDLLRQFERVARARYRVSAAGHPDVIRVQVELGKMEDRLRQLNDLRAPQTARLNAALNRAPDAPIAWPSSIADSATDSGMPALLGLLREHNPDLIALDEEVERERYAGEAAKKEGLPDFTLGVAYTVVGERDDVDVPDNGQDAVLASVSVNIPLWRQKYDAGVREAVARRLAVANRQVERRNRLAADLQEALFEHGDARRRVGLYRDTLIPKATESLEASLGGFEQGTVDFLDLVDAERTLLEFQLALERALVDRASSLARIEQLVGTRLSPQDGGSAEEATP